MRQFLFIATFLLFGTALCYGQTPDRKTLLTVDIHLENQAVNGPFQVITHYRLFADGFADSATSHANLKPSRLCTKQLTEPELARVRSLIQQLPVGLKDVATDHSVLVTKYQDGKESTVTYNRSKLPPQLGDIFVLLGGLRLELTGRVSFAGPVPLVTAGRGLPAQGMVVLAALRCPIVAPGEKVDLDFLVRNEGSTPQHFYSQPYWDISLMIQDDKGQLVPLDRNLSADYSCSNCSVAPNREFTDWYPLSNVYDLPVGTYRITATHHQLAGPENQPQYFVVSNTALLTVSNDLSKDFSLTATIKEQTGIVEKADAAGHLIEDIFAVQGKPVVLHLTLRNISATAKTLPWPVMPDTALQVQDFRGDVLTPLKRDLVSKPDVPPTTRTLQPGEALEYDVPVDELYNLQEIGRYFITATFMLPDNEGRKLLVPSNTVILTIAKPPLIVPRQAFTYYSDEK